MPIRRIDPGPRMSEVVIHNGVVYLAGQIGDGETTREQTRDALAEIDMRLEAAGTDKSKLLSATVWLADIADFDEMNAAWDEWVDPENSPARATGEVRLADPSWKVEIIVTAAL